MSELDKIREALSRYFAIQRDMHRALADRYDKLIMELAPELFEEAPLTKGEIEAIPRIDLDELEKLPWTKWQKDEKGNRIPADPGDAGWVKNPSYFTNMDAPPVQLELAKAIKKAGGQLELGPYVFKYSGKQEQFIARTTKKKAE